MKDVTNKFFFEEEIITIISDLIFIVLASVDAVASTSTMDTAENKEISGSAKDIANIISVYDDEEEEEDNQAHQLQQPAGIILLNC